MSRSARIRTLYLAPESRLGQEALHYWSKVLRNFKAPEYMRLTGDGGIAFGWREDLPYYTQESHFTDEDGVKYDVGENKVSIHTVIEFAQQAGSKT